MSKTNLHSVTCPTCQGTGKIAAPTPYDSCGTCGGLRQLLCGGILAPAATVAALLNRRVRYQYRTGAAFHGTITNVTGPHVREYGDTDLQLTTYHWRVEGPKHKIMESVIWNGTDWECCTGATVELATVFQMTLF